VSEAPRIEGRFKDAPEDDRRTWFLEHVSKPPQEIADFLSGTEVDISGARVLDVGCGDGIIDLGMTLKFKPYEIVGTDLFPTDVEDLAALSRKYLDRELPDSLRFAQCTESMLPFADSRFDFVMSWSVFEHVSDPVRVFSEIHRVLRPRGYMFLQIWPLFHSQRGSHLWKWYPDGWEHLRRPHEDLRDEISHMLEGNQQLLESTMADFTTLNRVTLGQLQSSMMAAGLKIKRVAATADTIDVPEDLLRYPLSDLVLSEIKILAVKD
jgi:SAM-dependent methyltransferase